jgi:hypothetical protein
MIVINIAINNLRIYLKIGIPYLEFDLLEDWSLFYFYGDY